MNYSDVEMIKWVSMRIEVKGAQAKLFMNDNRQPSLVVNDLKHGADVSGAIGLWVEVDSRILCSYAKIYCAK